MAKAKKTVTKGFVERYVANKIQTLTSDDIRQTLANNKSDSNVVSNTTVKTLGSGNTKVQL